MSDIRQQYDEEFKKNAVKLSYVRIPAYPDGNSGSIRTLNRKHPDTLH
jgi:allantoicase